MAKPKAEKQSLEDWFAESVKRTTCVICRSPAAMKWIEDLRAIVKAKRTVAPRLEAQAERISSDVGILVTPSQLRRHNRSCDR